jgi:hypothetical protein
MTGWVILDTHEGKRYKYTCDCCFIFYVAAVGEQPRTFCCGKFVEPKESLFSRLPTERVVPHPMPTVLPGRMMDFGADAERR